MNGLQKHGIITLPSLSRAKIQEMNDYLLSRPIYANAHVPQTSRNAGQEPMPREMASASECVCVHTDDAILAPHLIEKGLSTIDLAAEYLGRDPPVAYSMNIFWTRPGPAGTRPDIQEFHTDSDDERFLAMFVYLTDILDRADGPHELVDREDGAVHTVYGPAGTVFLADTSLPHRGVKPTRGERGIAWFRWGVSDFPPANRWDKIEPIDIARLGQRVLPEPRLHEAIRLLATPK